MKIRNRMIAPAIAVTVGIVLHAMPAQASAAPSPAAETCAAFQAWDHKRTTANLDAMMQASFTAPWKYVGEDASGLYADVRSGASKYITKDITYFGEDCPK